MALSERVENPYIKKCNSAHREGGAILTYSSVVLGGSVQFINNTAVLR